MDSDPEIAQMMEALAAEEAETLRLEKKQKKLEEMKERMALLSARKAMAQGNPLNNTKFDNRQLTIWQSFLPLRLRLSTRVLRLQVRMDRESRRLSCLLSSSPSPPLAVLTLIETCSKGFRKA